MRFYCEKSTIASAVSIVSKMAVSKSTLKAIEGIFIKLTDNKLYLTGFDLEVGIQTFVNVKGDENGEIILNARLLNEILRKMPDGDIMVSVNESYMTEIKSADTEYTIIGLDPSEYPALPELHDYETITLKQPVLKSMIHQTVFAASTDENRPVLNGAKFEIEEGVCTVIALDGYRLAIRKERLETTSNYSFIVPSKALNEVSKLLSDDDELTVKVSVGKKHIVFQIEEYMIISRLLEGEFLDHKSSLAKESTTQVKISTSSFIRALERTSLLISENTISPVKCKFSDTKLNISCISALGKIYDNVAVKLSGSPIEIGFNNRYLLDALRAADTDEVLLKISGALSPMKIVPPDGDDFLFLVLPMRI